MRKAAERGATLTRQLLAFSRQQVVQTTVLDLNARLRETSKLLRPLMGDDVEIVIISRPSAVVEGDPVQLDQVILNLAVNARDAMPKGGKLVLETSNIEMDETMAAQHAPLTAGKYVQLTVSDNGTGMDQQPRHASLNRSSRPRKWAKGQDWGWRWSMGSSGKVMGTFWFTASRDAAPLSRFIYRPRNTRLAATGTRCGPAPGDVQTHDPAGRRRRNDANADETVIGRTWLQCDRSERRGNSIGHRGCRDEHIDVLLTDVVMRGISGPELVRQLASSRPKTKVIFMSGYTGELLSGHDVFQAGTRFLEKPFTRASLLKMVDAALEEAE